jgi:SpoVK/Ycf46/Vps4 family AAA+-type ATPase
MIRELLLWVKHRRTVVEEWGGGEVGGPIALFAGPSGTGKTFASSVIAAELGWPLYRVDLGQLVSKYVGETEKNLNRLFDAAHGRPMVLQFDEADSLFGKRGEIKEARDRRRRATATPTWRSTTSWRASRRTAAPAS